LTDGYAAAAPALTRGLKLLLAPDVTNEDAGRSLSLVSNRASAIVALELWDVEAFHLLASRRVELARDAGALLHLRFALSFLARSQLLAGAVAAAASTIDEAQLIAEASGNLPLVNAPMILAAWRGQEERASELIEATAEEAAARRWTSNAYARSVLYNGLGRHDAARIPDPIDETGQHEAGLVKPRVLCRQAHLRRTFAVQRQDGLTGNGVVAGHRRQVGSTNR